MKKTFLALFALSFCCILSATKSYAQKDTSGLNMPFKDGTLIYQDVVSTPNIIKSDLYKNAKQWFVDTFNNSKFVIQSEDKEEGKIVGKGIIYATHKALIGASQLSTTITIQVECKDDRYRYKIYDMSLESETIGIFSPNHLVDGILGKPLNGRSTYTKKVSREILSSIDTETDMLILSLKKYMVTKIEDF